MTLTPQKWTAIVLAGQRPGVDPLAAHFFQRLKALIHVGGEPMVTRVVRTLFSVPEIGRIAVLAQDRDVLADAVATAGPADMVESGAGISTSILHFSKQAGEVWPLFVTTADHPLLTKDMVTYFLAQSEGCDLAIGMVERATMLAAYPDNQRTWLKFRDGHWSGTNLFALRSDKARAALMLWAEAEQDRKKAWKLFLHFGPWLAFRALTRTIGLADGLVLAGKRLGLSARLIPMPFAEAAIDVDKPSDHALAEQILARRTP
jgi:molybdopterin-guanine dinucleotide biosynthesis protein A